MSGLNFNSTDNQPRAFDEYAYTEVSLSDNTGYNDYDLRSITSNISLRTGNLSKITGFRSRYNGQELTITNRMGKGRTIILTHLDDSSDPTFQMDLASNRGQDLTIADGCSAVLKYDNTVSKWWLISYFEM